MNSRVSTRERLREEYARSVKEFARKVKGLDASGIPAPHIPIVGDSYDKCSFKIAFVPQCGQYVKCMEFSFCLRSFSHSAGTEISASSTRITFCKSARDTST